MNQPERQEREREQGRDTQARLADRPPCQACPHAQGDEVEQDQDEAGDRDVRLRPGRALDQGAEPVEPGRIGADVDDPPRRRHADRRGRGRLVDEPVLSHEAVMHDCVGLHDGRRRQDPEHQPVLDTGDRRFEATKRMWGGDLQAAGPLVQEVRPRKTAAVLTRSELAKRCDRDITAAVSSEPISSTSVPVGADQRSLRLRTVHYRRVRTLGVRAGRNTDISGLGSTQSRANR